MISQPRFGLHLGMPKTGTTCMQNYLFPKHSQIVYLGKFSGQQVKFNNEATKNLHSLALGDKHVSVKRCRQLISEQVTESIQQGQVPVWSKEGLTAGGRAKKRRQALRFREIPGRNCREIVFVRHPYKFMESQYFQHLKGFHVNKFVRAWTPEIGPVPTYFTIDEWLDVNWKLPIKGAFGHLLCAETAEVYAEVFGRENVRLFLFEKLVTDRRATITEMSRFIGIDGDEAFRLFDGKRANDRWSNEQIKRLKKISKSKLKIVSLSHSDTSDPLSNVG